ncbi:MAG: outer membrane beta-barrel protein [Bacteroidota bacterium]
MLTKTFTFLLFLVFFAGPLSAQTTIGLKVLAGASSLTSSADALPANIGRHKSVNGTTFGVVVERNLGYHISLRSGFQQSQRGLTLQQGSVPKLLGAAVPRDYEAQIRMNYLEVPLALKFRLPVAEGQVELYGWGGATAGYALAGSIRSRSATSMNFQLTTAKLDMANYAFPRFHLGYTGGLGFGLNLGETLQFRLEAEYNRSARDEAMISSESGKHGYQLLHFGAGMVFRL